MDAVVEVMEVPGTGEEVDEDEDAVSVGMIHWLVTSAGCMAMWPITIPTPVPSH